MIEEPKKELSCLANKIRATVLMMAYKSKTAHIGSNLSAADIITVLYDRILKINAENPLDKNRDRLIMSKGHSAALIWAILAEKGFFPKAWLNEYCKDGGKLFGHVTYGIPGIEFSTGSLGHGLAFGVGTALAAKRDFKPYHTFVVLSDGELDEGSNWEAFLFAAHHQLDNLTVVLDYNKMQSFGKISDITELEPLSDKMRSFGWSVREIDGHNHAKIESALSKLPFEKGKPSFVIAHTVKGKGISFMEDKIEWHYFNINETQLNQAFNELGIKKEDVFGIK